MSVIFFAAKKKPIQREFILQPLDGSAVAFLFKIWKITAIFLKKSPATLWAKKYDFQNFQRIFLWIIFWETIKVSTGEE